MQSFSAAAAHFLESAPDPRTGLKPTALKEGDRSLILGMSPQEEANV
jgi:hypothetical protein